MPRPIPGKQDPRFPKVWHGNFIVLLGLVIAFLGDFGFLGGMQHREEDLDTASRFVFCGFGLVVLGFYPGCGIGYATVEIMSILGSSGLW
jgi:hypothetical protein